MDLLTYTKQLPHGGMAEFARRCSITPVYLSQLAARQDGRVPSPELAVTMERESGGKVTRSSLRPDDYWLIWPDLKAPKQKAAA